MATSARSFCFTNLTTTPAALTRPLAAVRSEVTAPSGGLVFVSGGADVGAIASQVRAAWSGVPVCILPAAGVLTERAEVEGAPAVSGILWSGGKVAPIVVSDECTQGTLRSAVTRAAGGGPATVLLFPRSDFSPELLEDIASDAPGVCLFGAGTVGGAAVVVTEAGEILRGRAVGLAIRDFAPPLVESSAACRLVSPLRRIDEVSNGLVLTVDGTPALELLSSCVPAIRGAEGQGAQHVVFAALSDEGAGDRYIVRPVRGIEPARQGVMIGAEAKPGMRLAFAVRDAAAARSGLEAAARELSKKALGSAPRFAVYLSCAGRGQGLYGATEVESRILRQRFGDLPIAGMHSAFEITPWGAGEAKLSLYTGVLALFRAPS